MTDTLQGFDFRSSRYLRPTQRWVCGWKAKGEPCRVGPDHKGQCRASFECKPLQKGGRWFCTRSETSGGKCAQMPLPDGTCARPIPRCRPVRSWRARRGYTARWVATITIGVVALCLGGSAASIFVSPGEVTFQHSRGITCGGCHGAFDAGPTGWLHAAFVADSTTADSKRCLSCHELGKHGLRAHGLAPAELTAMSGRAAEASGPGAPLTVTLVALALDPPHRGDGNVACATCHREHQGFGFDLTEMSAQRCLACHQAKFTSLAEGHPRFTAYPTERRTRLIFDHASHIGKHFKGKLADKAPRQCKGCHKPDTAGRTMLVDGFDLACAACHLGQIEGEGRAEGNGIPIVVVPGLDIETLRDLDAAIGEWPEDADNEAPIPFMQLLLAGDDGLAAVREALAELDLLDLSDAGDDEIAAVEQLAWAVKGLLFDLVSEGMPALEARIEQALGRELGSGELAALSGQAPFDAVRAAQRAWFPNLIQEVPRHRAGEPVLMPEDDASEAAPEEAEEAIASGEAWATGGGWYRDYFSLYYRPSGHGDRFLRAWLDVSGGGATRAAQELFVSLTDRNAPGLCVKCHSVDAADDSVFVVNWVGARPVANQQKFTRFSHASHFPLLGEKGCLSCHKLDPEADFAAGFKDADPATFVNNFHSLERETCAACHTGGAAGDACLTCHNYHIGIFRPVVAANPSLADD